LVPKFIDRKFCVSKYMFLLYCREKLSKMFVKFDEKFMGNRGP